jgi:hypothetical protein
MARSGFFASEEPRMERMNTDEYYPRKSAPIRVIRG